MDIKQLIDGELGRIFGSRDAVADLTIGDKVKLKLYDLAHPLGVHHRVKTLRWDNRLQRLIDEGMACRVCGRVC